jgi:hypothetical protein
MVTLRCTQKLLKRLRVRPSGNTPAPSSLLGDWYAAPLSVGHTRLIMCVSETSLLPAFVRSQSGVGLITRFREAVVAVLEKLGVARALVLAEKQHLADVIIGTTISRNVLGSMTDFGIMARWHIRARGDGDLVAIALKLAEAPCGPLDYRSPEQVAREVLGAV